ncbi:hypothetical protein SAMN04488543_2049 [Friedmanniella luteola]|uniref:Extracellular repeat, HAF family n=1 Tax=Friedmanniella luteola TaxID=546871 RepID=A0A1H1TKV8_9ACTN|nr:hypothetical protein [Friedmanniella luteola]SDS60883.1 hypothetical protein SAMN04488543_2049 [Friedmanniella luteola]
MTAPRSSTARGVLGVVAAALIAGASAPAAQAAPTTAPPAPAYVARDLTAASGQAFVPSTVGNPVNEKGLVAGSTTVGGTARAAVFDLTARTIRVLAAYPGQPTRATDVNLAGEVVGVVGASGAGRAFAWRTSTGAVTLLAAPGATSSTARAINDRGVAVGAIVTSAGSRATVWNIRSGNRFTLAMDAAVGINENGAVVGYRYGLGTANQALVWTPATLRVDALRPLAGDDSAEPDDVNDRGVVVGRSYSLERDDLVTRPVLWSSRTATPCSLTTATGNSDANALNNRGQVVGTEVSYAARTVRGVVWAGCGQPVRVLPVPAGATALPSGLDDGGRVVGSTATRGVVWTPAG